MEAFFWLGCTILIYWMAKRLYRKFNKAYLTPLLLTPVIVIAAVGLSGVSYEVYDQGAGLLSDMVEPATIALAVILYRNFNLLKKNATVILASVGCGALAAIATSVGIAHLLGLSDEISSSLAPRSSTTPIAVSISSIIGGVPTITAAATIVTGLMGMIMGPQIVKWFRIKHPVARGLLLGISAHSAGISKALEYGAVSGAVAGIAMIFTAFVTLFAAPWVIILFQ
ncbi:LrgB family protein [Paenibacillus nasutitermitis]|uniref:Murein hydrolase effector protein n=1 Tax=Paenibacillus nasutitermitis TaxID=1652958 RepID=A0A916ZD22_9BACL|nr:LrgB family protein [Paenibacillus nasutitermitis]GGD89516.1 murein hydrolase effector protein [Paenibacillus nasutitermitis]